MFDDAYRFERAHQRARGGLIVAAKRRGDATVLDDLRQEGCLKARFPRGEASGWLGAVTINSSGGVAAGDVLDVAIGAGEGARLVVAAQAAERFYRAVDGSAPALVATRIDAGPDASVEFLPQESIMFDGAALDRRLSVDLAPDARFLGAEMIVFGREAMGETVRTLSLADRVRVRRGGRLLLHDAIRVEGDAASLLERAASGGGARAVATLWSVGHAADALDLLRALGLACEAGVSAIDALLVMRFVGAAAGVRAGVASALGVLRAGRGLPRVWRC